MENRPQHLLKLVEQDNLLFLSSSTPKLNGTENNDSVLPSAQTAVEPILWGAFKPLNFLHHLLRHQPATLWTNWIILFQKPSLFINQKKVVQWNLYLRKISISKFFFGRPMFCFGSVKRKNKFLNSRFANIIPGFQGLQGLWKL